MDDLISRRAALDVLEWKWAGKAALDAIKSLPTAEPRKGEWLDACGDMKCSCCGFECDDPYYLGEANYCPICGARMEE